MHPAINPNSYLTGTSFIQNLEKYERKLDKVSKALEERNTNYNYIWAKIDSNEGNFDIVARTSWLIAALEFFFNLLISRKNYATVKFGDEAKTFILSNMKEEFENLEEVFLNLQSCQLDRDRITLLQNTSVISQKMSTIYESMEELADFDASHELTLIANQVRKIWDKLQPELEEKISIFNDFQNKTSKMPNLEKANSLSELMQKFHRQNQLLNQSLQKVEDEKHEGRFNDDILNSFKEKITVQRNKLIAQLKSQFNEMVNKFKDDISQAGNFEKVENLYQQYKIISNYLQTNSLNNPESNAYQKELVEIIYVTIGTLLSEKLDSLKQNLEQEIILNQSALEKLENANLENKRTRQQEASKLLEQQINSLKKMDLKNSLLSAEGDLKEEITNIVKLLFESLLYQAAKQNPDLSTLYNLATLEALQKQLKLPDFQDGCQDFYIALNLKMTQLLNSERISSNEIYQKIQKDIQSYEKSITSASEQTYKDLTYTLANKYVDFIPKLLKTIGSKATGGMPKIEEIQKYYFTISSESLLLDQGQQAEALAKISLTQELIKDLEKINDRKIYEDNLQKLAQWDATKGILAQGSEAIKTFITVETIDEETSIRNDDAAKIMTNQKELQGKIAHILVAQGFIDLNQLSLTVLP